MGVTFSGANKLIICSEATTRINVKEDIYSAWKEWVTSGNNAMFLPAISAIGGDPITDVQSLGSTFFLENGWKIRPYEGSHTLIIEGNIYTRDGSNPVVSTIGDYNVMVNMSRSNLIDTISTSGNSGTSITAGDIDDIVQAVWNKAISGMTASVLLNLIEQKVDDNQALILMRMANV